MTWIKLCGMVRPEDIQFAYELQVEAVGLVMVPGTPRALSIDEAIPLAAIPRGESKLVLVFQNHDWKSARQAISILNPDMLQFHGPESAQFCMSFSKPYIKATRQSDAASMNELKTHNQAEMWMIDSPDAWVLLPEAIMLNQPIPIITAGGLTVANVASRLRRMNPFGVDVSRGIEESPRKKDRELMKQFVATVRGFHA